MRTGRKTTLIDAAGKTPSRAWRRRAVFLALGGLCVGAAAAAGWSAAHPERFTAHATLQIKTGLSLDGSMAENQARLARSGAVLSRVVEQEGLAGDAAFMPTPLGSFDGLLAAAGLGGGGGEARASAAQRGLLERLSVTRDGSPDLVQVAVRSATPEQAAQLANAVATTSISALLENRSQAARQAAQRDATRLATLQTKLYEAETRLIAARQQAGAGADPKAELAAAKLRTAEARQRLEQAQRLGSPTRAQDADAETSRSPVLDRLQARVAETVRLEAGYRLTLGPRHPVMVDAQQQVRDARKALADEARRSVDAAKAELAAAEAAEAAAAKRSAAAQAAPDAASAKLRSIEAEVEANRGAYEQLLRAKTAADDGEPAPAVTLLAPATPATAVADPALATLVGAGATLGLTLGGALGLLLGAFTGRGRQRSEDDFDASHEVAADVSEAEPDARSRRPAFELLSAGAPPAEPAQDAPEPPPAAEPEPTDEPWVPGLFAVADEPDAPYSHAVQDLADAVLDQAEDGRAYTVLVTSLATQSGKSTLAANLARAASFTRRRVLLVDAHSRNPTLSLAFGLGAEPGLIRIGGRVRPIHALDGAWDEGLFFMPVDTARGGAAPRLPDGAQLRFDGLDSSFDLIVIDGPPAGTEPTDAALAATADQVLLVSPPGDEADPAWASALLAIPRAKLRELPMAA